jgi:secreted trypsin-like serine protease
MKFYLLCTVLLLSLLIPTQATAIENGLDATGNQHVVKVISTYSKNKRSFCSGGLLSDYVVVTAAHCLNDESGRTSKEIWVLPPGSVAKRDSGGVILKDATWIQVDSTQITTTFQNTSNKVEDDDLAFLVLSRPIELKVKTLIASEDETSKLKTSNAALRLYGYGYISDSGKTSDAPNYYVARFDSQVNVSVKNSGYATSTDATACQGDSGGPVLSVTATSVTVVGVITGGDTSEKCGKKFTDGKYYTLFTYLSRYANLAFAAASSPSEKVLEVANAAKEEKTVTERALAQLRSELISIKSELDSTKASLSSAQSAQAALVDERSILIANNAALTAEVQSRTAEVQSLNQSLLTLKADVELLTKYATSTINCIKGKTVKRVTGIDPKCPSGYNKK